MQDTEGLITSQIFELVKKLTRDQRLSLALAIVHDQDRAILDCIMQPVRFLAGIEPGEGTVYFTEKTHDHDDHC
jgi:hypothetical protein